MKTHLADSSAPLKEGSELTAICGAVIANAVFVFMWDGDIVGGNGTEVAAAISSAIGMCRKCVKTEKELDRYIYGICAGEEMKQRRAGEEA